MSLGKGLSALITPTGPRKKNTFNTGDPNAPQKVWMVPLSEISASAHQPRKNFSVPELEELAGSIREHGILQPLLVVEKTNGGYELVAGERRLRAAKLAGLSTVPAMVKELSEQTKLEVALIENIQRENLNSIEEAFAYKRLIEEFGLTQQEVAEKVGKSRPAVANAIRLLELPQPIQTALVSGKINTGQARALLTLSETQQQLDMFASMLGQKITVRELERVGAKMNAAGLGRRDPNLLYLEDQARAALGAKVTIRQKGERGTITIDYYSKDELANLIKAMCAKV